MDNEPFEMRTHQEEWEGDRSAVSQSVSQSVSPSVSQAGRQAGSLTGWLFLSLTLARISLPITGGAIPNSKNKSSTLVILTRLELHTQPKSSSMLKLSFG